MSTEWYSINSADRVVQHDQYLLWYDSTPAGRARQHGSSQRKKTKLDGAPVAHQTIQNTVGNTPILPHQKAPICYPTSAAIDNSSSHQQPRPSVATTEKPPYNNTNIASQPQQGRISKLQSKVPAPTDTRVSTRAKIGFGKGRLTAAVTSVTVRATSTKDRHSKVRTAKGLRDRRVRLSAPTAVRFFDVQDRLGYDQPSKAMDWLIKKAQAAIKDLAPVKSIVLAGNEGSRALGITTTEEINRCQDADEQCEKEDQQSNRGVNTSSPMSSARDRAKEKANRDNLLPTNVETIAPPPGPTPPVISMSPDILLLSPPLQPSNFSSTSILPQSATSYIMPPPTDFFCIPPKSNASFIFHDLPTLLSSATSSYHTKNNTLISPRGTLQSIFVDSVTSPVPAMQSYDMMGPRSDTYEAAGTGDIQSTELPASLVDLCIPVSMHSQEYPKMQLPL